MLTLTELGKFRVIGTEYLAKSPYHGSRETLDEDVRNLTRQSLIRKGVFEGPDAKPPRTPNSFKSWIQTRARQPSEMRYVDQGAEVYEAQYRQQQINSLKRKAAKLGFQVIEGATLAA